MATRRSPPRTPSAALVERLRAICMSLPDANERLSHGEPAWFAGKGRSFAMLDDHHHGAPHLSVWLPQPVGAQESLIESDPARFFRPPYVGPSGWVGVVLDTEPDWDVVAELVRGAYAHVATAKLKARLSSPLAPAPPDPKPRRRAKAAPADDGHAAVDAYLARWPAPTANALAHLRAVIRRAAPDAVETIAYQLPTLRLGRNLVAFGAAKHHCALYPMSDTILARFEDELAAFDTSKGTIRFQPDAPLPDELVTRIVRARIEENRAKDGARAKPKKA